MDGTYWETYKRYTDDVLDESQRYIVVAVLLVYVLIFSCKQTGQQIAPSNQAVVSTCSKKKVNTIFKLMPVQFENG